MHSCYWGVVGARCSSIQGSEFEPTRQGFNIFAIRPAKRASSVPWQILYLYQAVLQDFPHAQPKMSPENCPSDQIELGAPSLNMEVNTSPPVG